MSITTCGPKCTTEQKNGYGGCGDPIETHVGTVLATFEQNGYDDSDFLAIVWDGEKYTTVVYASTRGWTYHNHASVDATEEVIAAATEAYRVRLEASLIERATAEAARPTKGKTIRSLTRSGKNKGAEGIVMWFGEDRYRPNYYGVTYHKVGFKVDGESKLRYIAAEQAQVIDPEPIDVDAIKAQAATAEPHNWHSALYVGFSREMTLV